MIYGLAAQMAHTNDRLCGDSSTSAQLAPVLLLLFLPLLGILFALQRIFGVIDLLLFRIDAMLRRGHRLDWLQRGKFNEPHTRI